MTIRTIVRETFWLSCLMWGILLMISGATEGVPYTSIHVGRGLAAETVGGVGFILTALGMFVGFSIGHAGRRRRMRWQEAGTHPAERVLATLQRLRQLPGKAALAELQMLRRMVKNYNPDTALAMGRVEMHLEGSPPDDRGVDSAWDDVIGKTGAWLRRVRAQARGESQTAAD
jgi:hypothetical protein